MTPPLPYITIPEVKALFNCSQATAYRIVGRLRLARLARGKYLVDPAAIRMIALRAMAGVLPQVSTHSAADAAPQQAGRGVGAWDREPRAYTSSLQKNEGQGEGK